MRDFLYFQRYWTLKHPKLKARAAIVGKIKTLADKTKAILANYRCLSDGWFLDHNLIIFLYRNYYSFYSLLGILVFLPISFLRFFLNYLAFLARILDFLDIFKLLTRFWQIVLPRNPRFFLDFLARRAKKSWFSWQNEQKDGCTSLVNSVKSYSFHWFFLDETFQTIQICNYNGN